MNNLYCENTVQKHAKRTGNTKIRFKIALSSITVSLFSFCVKKWEYTTYLQNLCFIASTQTEALETSTDSRVSHELQCISL